jgi:hypothetical protein
MRLGPRDDVVPQRLTDGFEEPLDRPLQLIFRLSGIELGDREVRRHRVGELCQRIPNRLHQHAGIVLTAGDGPWPNAAPSIALG